MNALDLAVAFVLLGGLLGAVWNAGVKDFLAHPGVHGPSSAPATVTAPNAKTAMAQLNSLKTLPSLPDVAGYQRGCGKGQACSFGAAWTDDSTAPDGHNGCGTRDDVLREQMSNVTTKPGSRCIVISGVLHDTYTGKTIDFRKSNAMAVQIDHMVPLALAWNEGANAWTQAKRTAFANDTKLNLTAVDGPANNAKSDKGPGQWLPPNKAYWCTYASRYIAVSAAYQLPVTLADKAGLMKALATCG